MNTGNPTYGCAASQTTAECMVSGAPDPRARVHTALTLSLYVSSPLLHNPPTHLRRPSGALCLLAHPRVASRVRPTGVSPGVRPDQEREEAGLGEALPEHAAGGQRGEGTEQVEGSLQTGEARRRRLSPPGLRVTVDRAQCARAECRGRHCSLCRVAVFQARGVHCSPFSPG